MPEHDNQELPGSLNVTLAGYCPVCGEKIDWTPTARLWPTRRSAQAALASHSGTCTGCHRVLMFTVVSDSSED